MARGAFAPALVASLALALSGCGGSSGESGGVTTTVGDGGSSAAADALSAVVASYDLATGPPARFLVGTFVEGEGLVGRGTVDLAFSYLGKDKAGEPQAGPTASGAFLPIFGSDPGPGDRPAILPSDGRGVYAANVAFDRPGLWEVEVTAALDGGPRRATAAFSVLEQHRVPSIGDAAPPSENPIVGSSTPAVSIDSGALGSGKVPDPELHGTTIADALRRKLPILVVFSTPTFCQSQFCGPVTDLVAELAAAHSNRASFIHVEVWEDFEDQKASRAALEWLSRDGGDLNEPWVFLVGADGKVVARWDNVVTRQEVEPVLAALPELAS
ncbi:MAG: hypothetical protein ACRDV9_02920 [Acidimicrobiia bacterium]